MGLTICFVAFILIGIMVSIDNVAKELSEIRKILEEKEKQRMKKQIVLDEQDIKEFHEDAEHLR